jgi:putative tryptophan/tyrosine transport system substrate-binding protein
MRRREFIALVGGAAAASWPLGARAQQRAVPVIGFLNSQSAAPFSHMVAGFRRGLRDAGFLEGQNIAIEYRWADGHYDRLPVLATDLIRQGPAVLVATGGEPAALAAKEATQAIPIVFLIGGDPVRQGIVASMNRPGGNVTGLTLLTTEIEGKRLGLLQELVPSARAIAVLINPNFPPSENQRRDVLEAASHAGLRATTLFAKSESDFQPAFAALIEQRADALMVCADPLFNSRREQLVALAAHHKVPAMYEFREYVLAGGLVSYGVNIVDLYREAAQYTAKILKGAKPSDLPIVQPTKFDFVINQRTAKALRLDVPDKMFALADEVIE